MTWYLQLADGSVQGPFPERKIFDELLSGKISPDLKVRQGSHGAWCQADRARDAFQQLAEKGWYIQTGGETFGPFTPNRLLELHRAGEIRADARLRQGTDGDWKPADVCFTIWGTSFPTNSQAAPPASSTVPSKWSVEPIRHYALPLDEADIDVAKSCHPNERLYLRHTTPNARNDERLSVLRSNQQILGRLGLANSRQLVANGERGITHVCLFSMEDQRVELVMILCPPGSHREQCRRYIAENFSKPAMRS